MPNYEAFRLKVKETAEAFRNIPDDETIRIVSHLDCDGICAASIMIHALNIDSKKYSISIIQQLSENFVEELAREDYKYYVFTDLGSGALSAIDKHLGDREIFVLDHHELEDYESKKIHHLNPHCLGINGSEELAGSGVVYFFAKELNKKNENLAHIAVIGAIGDVQEKNGNFLKLNQEILESAIKSKKMNTKIGLRFFGKQTRPIHKVLEYTTDPFIPGVSGSESGAIQFLQSIGIEPKKGKEWRKIVHLSDDEKQKFASEIIVRRAKEQNPEDIFGNVYLLNDEKEESPLKDAREFSTLLNACGRMKKASVGIGTCLGNEKAKKKAMNVLADYRKEIVNALRWYEGNRDKNESIIKGKGYLILNAEDNVLHTVIGTLASILSNSNELKCPTYIMSLAQSVEDDKTKVSLRVSNSGKDEVDLRNVVKEISSEIGCNECGGHMNAAGAVIPTDKEKDFISAATKILDRISMEEKI